MESESGFSRLSEEAYGRVKGQEQMGWEGSKLIYEFSEGSKEMRNLLGGKGSGLAEMTGLGLPVPPGFVVTTEACNAFLGVGGRFPRGMWEEVLAAVKKAPESFAEVAKKNSQDPGSAANGGDLDFFARGAMAKAFEFNPRSQQKG